MIPLPSPPVRGQPIQADLQRAIIEAIRRCRPISGTGITLHETANGTIISATQQAAQPAAPFDFRFKVSTQAEAAGGTVSYALIIRKGSLYEVQNNLCAEQTLTLEAVAEDPDNAEAWRVDSPKSGSLFIRLDTADQIQTYTLAFGDPTGALAIIADYAAPTSSNPIPTLTQRVLGDLYIFPSTHSDSTPAAWTVRNQAGEWQIFSPYWSYKRINAIAEGMQAGWNTLASALTAGNLFAILQWDGSAADDGSVTWIPSESGPKLVSSLDGLPADADPSGSGSSATPGIRIRAVLIGTFSGEGEAKTFSQAHTGVIVETLEKGLKGEKGDPGPQGPQGDPGPQGPTGTFDTGSEL
ncbi:MAG: hypothetical protein ACI4RT_05310, partial [Candidatus Spyradenecus sp.]